MEECLGNHKILNYIIKPEKCGPPAQVLIVASVIHDGYPTNNLALNLCQE
jgi:hypothetical protein